MSIINNNWFNLNSTRRYPLDDLATGESDTGADFPNDIITDLRIRFPRSAGRFASISSINCSTKIVTVTIIGHELHPSIEAVQGSSESFKPLAVVSIPRPVIANVPYKLKGLEKGVFGWIVFGEGVEKQYSARFSNASQALLMPRLAHYYVNHPVTSVSVNNSEAVLTGDITLRAIGDLKIIKGQRSVRDVGLVDAFIFRLENSATGENLYKKYLGRCQGRPESESCNKISVEYINDISPDCDGNINLEFSRNELRGKDIIDSDMRGIAVEIPLGLAEACTRNDYLPDNQGRLPNEYADQCATIAASEGDPDAVAYVDDLVQADPPLSMTVLPATNLPYSDDLVYTVGGDMAPVGFEFVNSQYTYDETPYNRGFPEDSPSTGLIVKSKGSRFVGVWNDDANEDRAYTADVYYSSIAPEVSQSSSMSLGSSSSSSGSSSESPAPPYYVIPIEKFGCRASVSFVFYQTAALGSAGVILDYSSLFSESCNKYVKSYIIGAMDSSTKQLKIYRWTGTTWAMLAKSEAINGVSSGEWYSLDFQKDSNDTFDGKIKYKLKLYTAADYWADTSGSQSLYASVGSKPKSGYEVPMSYNLIASLDVSADSLGVVNGRVGFGTVISGSPAFSHFFVG
jgi:hypothetical protein